MLKNIHKKNLVLNNMNRNTKYQSGISLFDFVLWFAVVGVFLAVLYGTFAPAKAQSNAQALSTEIPTVQSAVRTYYNGAYKGLKMEDLVKSGLMPGSIKLITNGSNPTLSSTAGGNLKIAEGQDNDFTIDYTLIPANVCKVLARRLSFDTYKKVNIGGSDITSASTPNDINSACESAKNGGVNFVITSD